MLKQRLFILLALALSHVESQGGKVPDIFKNIPLSSSTEESFGLNVGTSRNGLDVVSDDAVVEGYSADSAPLVTSASQVAGFWISRTKEKRVMVQRPQPLSQEGVVAKLVQWEGPPVKEAPLTTDPEKSLGFSVQTTCHKKGEFKVTVLLRVFRTSERGLSDNKLESAKDVSFVFLRNCSRITSSDSEALLGLSVILEQDDKRIKVMENGLPVTTFSVASTKVHVVQDPKVVFLVTAPLGTVLGLTAIAHDPLVASVSVGGDMDFTQNNQPRNLTIGITCKLAAPTLISVFLKSQSSNAQAQFVFQKTCAGTTTSRAIGVRQPGLNIMSGSAIIVSNGMVQSAYKPAMRRSDDSKIERAVIPATQSEMNFTVTVPQTPGVVLQFPWVSATPYTGQHPIVRPKLKMDRKAWKALPTSLSTTFRVQFGCFDEGQSNVVVTILVENQGEIEFVLRKECKEDSSGGVGMDVADQVYGLNIGLTPRGKEVVDNGTMTSLFHWTKRTDKLDTLYLIPAKTPFITFHLSGSINLMYNTPQIAAGEELAEVDITGSGAQGGYIDAKHPTSTVSLSFHCIVDGRAIYNLALPLTEYVNPLEMDYDYDMPFGRRLLQSSDYEEKMIVITFQKECSMDSTKTRPGLGGLLEPGLMVCFNAECSGEDAILVDDGFPTKKFYGQRRLPPEQRFWDIIPNTTQSLRLFVLLRAEINSTRTLDIRAPLIVRDSKVCSPVLSGSMLQGTKLHRGKPAEELDITFNCEYQGLAVMSLVLPVVPRGSISITLAKQCSGPAEPAGVLVSGLNIGITPDGQEVVANGLTTPKFNKYNPSSEDAFVTEKDETVFYISRKTGESQRALEPIVFAHRPILAAYLSHELHVIDGVTEEDDDMIIIDKVTHMLNVSYSCYSQSYSAVTLIIPLLPEGTVQFTWQKSCEGEEDSPDFYEGNGDGYSYDTGYEMDDFSWNENPDLGRGDGLGYFNVGTSPSGSDVVEDGVTSDRYTMGGDGPNQMRMIINKDVNKVAYYLSIPEDSEEIAPPEVRVLKNNQGTVVCQPTLTGNAVMGGELTPGKGLELVVLFNCVEGATGVSPVLVTIPLRNGGQAISFRVLKICGVFKPVIGTAWTPARVLWVSLGVIVAAACLCFAFYFKCRNRGVKYTKVGARSNLPNEFPLDTFGDDDLSDG